VPFVSSIFLRRLLCPGVHHNISLRATLLDYNRHWTDSEYHSLTADGLKKEILSLIETEVLFALILLDSNYSLYFFFLIWK
jgi:nuclear pore complex protein Nup160